MEQLRAKADQESNEARVKVNRLEDRVANLSKLKDQLEAQLKTRDQEIEAIGCERQADLRLHEEAIADKEKKL